jgi:membrane protease YdiL (CAAX protease family)
MIVTIPAQLMESFGFNHYLSELTGCPEQQNVVESMAKGTPEVKAVIACMAVLVAPITEECLFRGFIYNILKNKSGAISAAIASSILFSAVHTSLAQFIPLTLFALVQCYLYEKSRSLALPIIFHMLFNGVSTLVILSL